MVVRKRDPAQPASAARMASRRDWAGPYLLLSALIAPLLYSTHTIDPVEPLRFLVITIGGLFLASLLVLRAMRSPDQLELQRTEMLVLGCLAATLLWAGVSLLVAGPSPDGLLVIAKLATLGWLILASAWAIGGDRHRLVLLAKCVTVAAFVVGGFAVLQYYRIAIFEWMKTDVTVDSTMAHRNLLASYLALAFPFVAYGFFELEGRWRVASGVTMLVCFFLFVALQSRAVWVALTVAVVAALLLWTIATKRATSPDASQDRTRRRALAAVGLGVLGGILALGIESPSARAPMAGHAEAIVQLEGASIQERFDLWSRTLQIIGAHPVTGIGPGRWRLVFPTLDNAGLRSDAGTIHFQRPHNDFLWIASESGVPGGILYLGFFAALVVIGVRALLRATSVHDRRLFALLLFGITIYTVDSLFSFPMERTSHAVALALLAGALLSFQPGPPRISLSRRSTMVGLGLVWVAMLGIGIFALGRYRAEVHLRRALEARAVKDWPRMVAELDRIDARFYVLDPTSAPIAWYRGVARFEMGDRKAACEDFRRALEVHPSHVHVLNNLGTCATLAGDLDAAVRDYRRAIELAPRFEEARVNLGAVLHSLGKDEAAYEVLAPMAETATSKRFAEILGVVREAAGSGAEKE